MPGTVQVSVLGLMDLPESRQSSSTSPSPLSKDRLFLLKIAMGKTEYQTGDKGDFSFPVTSLRENLKLTLNDAGGNEISRTDVKTREVVEKKFWDSLFALEGGGCVHLKLQFILNAEEHKRIREMREAVLKKRHENTTGFSSNLISEGHLADRIPLKSQDRREKSSVASLPQELQQQPEKNQKEVDICQSEGTKEASGTQVNEINIHKTNSSLVETMDPQSRCSGFFVSEEITATSSSPSAMAQEERNSSTWKEPVHDKFPLSNIKKMISAFESISVQEPRTLVGPTTKSWIRKMERGHSSVAPWSEEINTENVTNGKIMSKSFSTGTLPQMKSTPKGLTYTAVEEEEKYSDIVIEKNLGNSKQFIESKDVQDCKIFHPGNKVSEFLYLSGSPSCERTSDMPEIIETKEVVVFCSSADIVKNVNQYPPHKADGNNVFQLREHEACQEKIKLCSFPEGVSFLDSETSYQNSDVTTSDCFEKEWSMLKSECHLFRKINKGKNEIVEGPAVCDRNQGGYPEFHEGRELIHTNEIRKDEEAFTKASRKILEPIIAEQLCRSSMHERQPNPSIVKAESRFSSASDDFSEVPKCGSSDVKLGVLMYFDVHQCLLGSHGNRIPRHLCITSGSKQLKDILGGFTSI